MDVSSQIIEKNPCFIIVIETFILNNLPTYLGNVLPP